MTYSFAQKAREAGLSEEDAQIFARVTPAMWSAGLHTANDARAHHAKTGLTDIDGITDESAVLVESIIFGVVSPPIEAMFPQIEVISEHLAGNASAEPKGKAKGEAAAPVNGEAAPVGGGESGNAG